MCSKKHYLTALWSPRPDPTAFFIFLVAHTPIIIIFVNSYLINLHTSLPCLLTPLVLAISIACLNGWNNLLTGFQTSTLATSPWSFSTWLPEWSFKNISGSGHFHHIENKILALSPGPLCLPDLLLASLSSYLQVLFTSFILASFLFLPPPSIPCHNT